MPEKEAGTIYTLVDLLKECFNKEVLPIAEILVERTPVLRTAMVVEANSLTSHVFDRRATEPSGTFTAFNIGIPYESTQVDQMEAPMCMCEALASVDQRILRKSPNPYKTRANRERAFVSGMGKTFEETFFYGSEATEPKSFNGLATLLPAIAANSVIDEGGSGSDCTSIYLVEWGEDTAYLIYPTGSKSAGIRSEELGRQLVSDGLATPQVYPAYVSHHIFEAGFVLVDPYAIQRIASIETSGSTGIYDYTNVIRAINNLPGKGRPVIYVNRDIMTAMDIDLAAKTNLYLTIDMAYGKKTTHFREVPVFRADQITTEDAL